MNPDDLALLIGRMDGKLDMLLSGAITTSANQEALSKRVSRVEGFNSKLLGIAVAVGAFITMAFEIVPRALAHLKG